MPITDPLKRLIARRHPLYETKQPHWDFLEATYEGGRDWFVDNIFRYVKEGEKEFADRLKRAYRFNHTREVVDLVDKYLFKMEVARKEGDAPRSVQQFWKRATLNGLDIRGLARRISQKSSIFGRVWVVVDSLPGQPVSVADEKAEPARTYAYVVRPQQVLDMSYDDAGELNWILIHEVDRDDSDPFASSGDDLNRFRLWTRADWRLFELRKKGNKVEIVQIDSGVHALGVVPVTHADCTISEELYASPALIDDIAYLDRAVANYLSNLDAIIQDQTFSQLAMPAQGLLPGEEGHTKLLEMSTKRVFTFNAEAGMAPMFLSPDPKQAELILSAIKKIINEIYHSVGLAGERTKEDNGGGVDNASGVAKGYDFERVNSMLASKADSLEDVENRICGLVARWGGDEVDDRLVIYPDNFDTRGLYDEFEIAARLSLLMAPDEARREQMRALVIKLFPAADAALRERLESAIKSWPPDLLTELGGTQGAKPLSAVSTQSVAKDMAT